GKLCAFILTYTPEFTPWRCKFTDALIQIFSQEFAIDTELVIREMKNEIEVIAERRNTKYSTELIEVMINSWRKQKILYKV
ncbi:MAG: hypothetical protein KGZ81_05105, partial [Flavobacteriales bacterium]|nr:hypothetical protein [Flavobacteriales bacterium]